MAPKRGANGRFKSSGGSLTGGTGDVKPQILTATLSAPASVEDYSAITVQVPRVILDGSGTATIMEVLKVSFYVGIEDIFDPTAAHMGMLSTTSIRVQSETATLPGWAADMANPTVIAGKIHASRTLTTGGVGMIMPLEVDLTDNNGNGVLVGTDRLFVTTAQLSNGNVSPSSVKILYRMVSVGITEYVGIVQSQLG